MRYSIRPYVLLFIFLASVVACKNDTADAGPSLFGRWEIQEARRNGRVTESLADLHFVFKEDGVLESNIGGTQGIGNFTRIGDEITTTDLNPALTYSIADLTDSTLHLKSSFSNYRFDFRLRRADDQSTLPAS